MNKLKEMGIYHKTPIIIAIVQWFITTILQVDRIFFTYDYETKIFILIKFLYLLFLIVGWCFSFDAYKKIKDGNPDYQRGFKIFLTYFLIMMILLLILWPGTWCWDDLFTLIRIQNYQSLNPWQHIITSIYQDILLQIFPFLGGIIFIQNILISICVAFSVTKLEKAYKIKQFKNFYIDIILKILPFLLPPVLMYQFSGYRIGLYVYLELVVLVILICAIKDKTEWNWNYLGLFCFLTVIVSVWRTESFFYIPFSCISILFINNTTIPKLKKYACILFLIIGFLGMNQCQNYALGNSNYKIVSLLRPCVELVKAADDKKDAENLQKLENVINLDVIHNNPSRNGEFLYFNMNLVKNDYTNEDYNNFFKAFIQLCLKYPQVVIAERWNLFIKGSGITGYTVTNINSANLFELNSEEKPYTILTNGGMINTPVFKQTRKSVINLLGGNINNTLIKILKRLIWNAITPMLFLIYAWFKLMLQKKWYLWLLCTAVIIRIPIVILTQPSRWIMYLLSFYLLGYVFIIYKTLIYFSDTR